MCTLLWQSKNDFSHLSWIYFWQIQNEKCPIPRRYITWTGTTVTILASKLIKFVSVQLSTVDKPRSANPINYYLTHLPDLSLKLEKKLISSSPFQFCAPQPEDLFMSQLLAWCLPVTGQIQQWQLLAENPPIQEMTLCAPNTAFSFCLNRFSMFNAYTNTMMHIDRLQVFWTERYYLKSMRFYIINSKWRWDSLSAKFHI